MSDLLIDVTDGIATLTMNRPDARNALSLEMRGGMHTFLDEHENDDSVRCVVIKGAGEHFMAGGDVKSFAHMAQEQEPDELRRHFLRRIHDLHGFISAMRRFPKPIVASVRGAAAGAGVSLAAACDLIISSEDAFFTLAYCHIGISPDGSATYALPRMVGVKKAMEMVLLGDRLSAQDMADAGLVNMVVPDADLDAETARLAGRLAKGPTRAYGHAKRLIWSSVNNQLEHQLQLEAEAFADCAGGHDFREGVTAFVEKRRPEFTGS